MRRLLLSIVIASFAAAVGCAGCEDETGQQENQAGFCEPGQAHCEDDQVVRCNSEGTAYLEPQSCDSDVCVEGQCGCASEADCADGESCSDGLCHCPSGVHCGADGICCGDGEICDEVEICDEDGDCDFVALCRPACEGSFCGVTGEICCEGDTPECGPYGDCAPDCSSGGGLCGDDFDECCAFGEACIFGDCRLMGEECDDFFDCDFGEYCDPGLGRCMPDDFPEDLVCERDYDFEEFESEFLWHWDGVEVNGSLHVNVAMTPVVADMTGSGTPDVVVNAYPTGSANQPMPVVIDGQSGETIYYNDTRWARSWSQLSLVDVTGDGLPEIVMQSSGGIGVIKNIVECEEPTADDDCFLWWNSSLGTLREEQVVADITGDGRAEILVSDNILDAETGELLASTGNRGYDYTVVADITGDGQQEILSAQCLLSLDATDGELDSLWCNGSLPGDGLIFAAVGDVADEGPEGGDRAGEPEFVLTGNGNVYVVAADTGDIIEQFNVPGGGNGGPPIIADFDGDGRAEIGVAGSGCYTVFDLDCLGSTTEDQEGCIRPDIAPCTPGVDCFGVQACPALDDTGGTGDGILWSVYIQDISSSRTGSSVFDFQGNGRNEVVYNDECLLMVLDGQTGEPRFRHPNTTRTASEYPIVVDVNGDSRTNFVVAANNDRFSRDCEDPIQNRPDRYPECHGDGPHPEWCTVGTTGVFALQDPEDRWVRTRQIWNQFAYHIDNVSDDAQVVTAPTMPWETHNTFRANRQGEVPLNAADVAVTAVQTNQNFCPPTLYFQVTVENHGVSSIPADTPLSIYDTNSDQYLYTTTLGEAIPPGGVITVSVEYELAPAQYNRTLELMIIANDDGSGEPVVYDCDPDKASYLLDPLECRVEI